MDYDQQPVYEAPRPAPPMLWIGLTFLFALCCCFFFVTTGAETVLLLSGASVGGASPTASGPKPAIGEVKFYLDQSGSGGPSGPAVTSVPTNTKTVYAYFTYKNMPKTGLNWSYQWMYNGSELPSASKANQKWTKEGSGMFFVRLGDDKGLKSGDYDLTILLGDEEAQTATLRVGP